MRRDSDLPAPRWRWAWRVGYGAVLVALLGWLLTGPYQSLFETLSGSHSEEPEARGAAPCLPGEAVEIMDSPYVSEREVEQARFNSLPPTSGPHLSFTMATGVYDHPVPAGLTIHAMEHGHIIIHYADSTQDAEIRELDRVARRYGADVILAPNPSLPHGIALTAWGRIDRLDAFDERRISAFVEALRDRYYHDWKTDRDC